LVKQHFYITVRLAPAITYILKKRKRVLEYLELEKHTWYPQICHIWQ